MNGAESVVKTLLNSGIEVCFTNPGTSEMHLLEALDKSSMRCVLGLQEAVVTGAADGYARMAGKPAATLLHLGPGLTNGLSNLHNAKRARTPVVNIVGDHATYHIAYDSPLTSDISGAAGLVSQWVRTSRDANSVAYDTAAAIAAAQQQPGQIATLIVPADVSWGDTSHGPLTFTEPTSALQVGGTAVQQCLDVLQSAEPCLMILGANVTESILTLASSIANHSDAKLCCDVFPTRIVHGCGTAQLERLPYLPEMSADLLKSYRHLILIGAKTPVAFFAYPHVNSWLPAEGTQVHVLADSQHDIDNALCQLCEGLGVSKDSATFYDDAKPQLPAGELNGSTICQSIGALLPENAIIVDEGITGGVEAFATTANSPKHEWIIQGGGAIGWGLLAAVGAAIACPDRKVVSLASKVGFSVLVAARKKVEGLPDNVRQTDIETLTKESDVVSLHVDKENGTNVLNAELISIMKPGSALVNAAFIHAFEKMANTALKSTTEGSRIAIKAPLISMTKAEIIKTGFSLGVDYSMTFSCYDPIDDNTACGKCDSCMIRLKGFIEAGESDPIKYSKNAFN